MPLRIQKENDGKITSGQYTNHNNSTQFNSVCLPNIINNSLKNYNILYYDSSQDIWLRK